jgi:hypothetical protein
MKASSVPASHADLLDGLKALRLESVTAADVGTSVKALFATRHRRH